MIDINSNSQNINIILIHQDRLIRRRYNKILKNNFNFYEFDTLQKFLDNNLSIKPDLFILCPQIFENHKIEFDNVIENVFLSISADNLEYKIKYKSIVNCIDEDQIEVDLVNKITNHFNLNKNSQLIDQQNNLSQELFINLHNEIENLKNINAQIELNREKAESQVEMFRAQDKNLHRISKTIRKSFDIKSNLRQTVDDLTGIYNLDCCFVCLPSDEVTDDTIRCESYSSEAYRIVENDYDLQIYELFKKTLNNKIEESIVISDTDTDPRYKIFEKSLYSNVKVNSLFFFPITYENKLLGILGGIKVESASKWSIDNESFLVSVAGEIAGGVVSSRLYSAVQRQATIDGLTGLLNHRTGQEKLAEQIKLAERYQRSLSIMMIDVDYFKSINDNFGHPAGDTVLKSVAKLIKNNCRDVDIAIRYGGEEFMLILPEIGLDAALVAAERIRKNLSNEIIVHEKLELKITASLGIASYPDDAKNQQALVALADKSLYLSKRLGRNQVHAAPDLFYEDMKNEIKPKNQPNPFIQHVDLPPISEEAKLQEEYVPEVIEVVKALASSLYSRNDYNKSHHIETAKLAETIARFMELPKKDIEQIKVAGLLHDVGTLAIPSEVLNKSGPMSELEKQAIKEHVTLGVEMLRPIRALRDICEILENHHERFDGTGYPKGLKGEEIPLASRILNIVDSFHAMISDRPYRKAIPIEDAIIHLRQEAGGQFDPLLVDIFITIIKDAYKLN